MIYTVWRVRKGPKPLKRPVLIHNRIEADTPAEALMRYGALTMHYEIRDLEVRAE